MRSTLKTAVNSAITGFTVWSRENISLPVQQACMCVCLLIELYFVFCSNKMWRWQNHVVYPGLPHSVSPSVSLSLSVFLLNRSHIFHSSHRAEEGFFLSNSCWVWLDFTMKYCPVLQIYCKCAVQPSGIRLMMFFTFSGDPVTKLGWIRCRIKARFVELLLLLLKLLLMQFFSDDYELIGMIQCLWMQPHTEWMTPIKTSILSNSMGLHSH